MIPIKTTKAGYKISYDPQRRRFVATNSKLEEIAIEKTQKELEDYLKKFEKKQFQRIKAVRRFSRSAEVGSITSIVKSHSSYIGDYLECWFVPEQAEDGERKSRGKHRISGFFQASPENIALAEKITKLQEQIHKKYAHIERLQQKFKDPITEKNVLKLAGVEA